MHKIQWPVDVAYSKYAKWYENLIIFGQNRTLPKDVYFETHHIIPRSFGGKDNKENLVKLTAKEHYIAHALLWKMNFPGRYGWKMSFAFNTFIRRVHTSNQHTYKICSRIYESARIAYSVALKEKIAKDGPNFKGCKHTEETRKIIGEKSKLKKFPKGKEHPNWGKKLNVSEEGKARRLEAVKTMWLEKREEILQNRIEASKRPDAIANRKKAADARRGVKRDPAIMEKCAVHKRGKKWEEIYSPETINKMHEARRNRVISPEGKERMIQALSNAHKGKPKSEEWKKKMSERMKGIVRPTLTCIHCGKIAVVSNHNRHHGDNCKFKPK